MKSYKKNYKFVLASASPRRRELLLGLICDFDIVVSDAEEKKYCRYPSRLVMQNAKSKGLSIINDGIIISADTIVFMDGKYFLKPKDERDAFDMLKTLSNRYHAVYTGVSIRYKDIVHTFYDTSRVKIRKMSDEEIWDYIKTGSPMDKAGAYGIQDNTVVEKYTGSFSNIMGLPMEKLEVELDKFLEEICL